MLTELKHQPFQPVMERIQFW